MIYHVSYTWNQTTTRQAMDQRMTRLLAGEFDKEPLPVTFLDWYELVGGAAGVLLIETDDPEAVEKFLLPYSDLEHWDIRPVIHRDVNSINKRTNRP